jgi:hypothetical protein
MYRIVGFEVLTAVFMKSSVFWHIKHWSACYLLHVGLLIGLFFDPENEGEIFFRKVG